MGRGSSCVDDETPVHVLFVDIAELLSNHPITLGDGHDIIVKTKLTLGVQPNRIVGDC